VSARSNAYKKAGVDIDAGERLISRIAARVHETFGPNVLGDLRGFANAYSLGGQAGLFSSDYSDPVLVACTDGVGTKLKLAFETNIHDTVGQDLVAMSVNDLITCGAEPLFFLDYFATGKLDVGVAEKVIVGIASACKAARCALIGGETAEMPDMYSKGEYDLAGFAVGVVERDKMIDGAKIEPGDVVIGMLSSGLHSNGYSLVRKLLLKGRGRMDLAEPVPELGEALGDCLLRPTCIYADAVRTVCSRYKVKEIVKALAHITGGGLIENIPRILPEACAVEIDTALWDRPPVFGLLQEKGKITDDEMYRVFNMGIGMVLVCPDYNAQAILRTLRSKRASTPSRIIGRVVKGKRSVKIKHASA